MNARAMTLLETMLSLALLSAAAVACAAWTTSTLRAAASIASGAGWERAAERVFDAVESDMLALDRSRELRARGRPAVHVVEKGVEVATRSVAQSADASSTRLVVARRYEMAGDGLLLRRDLDARGGVASVRPLLDGVRAFNAVAADDESASPHRLRLTLTIESVGGRAVERTFFLSTDDTR